MRDIINLIESPEANTPSKEDKALVRKLQTQARDAHMWASEELGKAADAISDGNEEKFREHMNEAERLARKRGSLMRQYRDILGLDY